MKYLKLSLIPAVFVFFFIYYLKIYSPQKQEVPARQIKQSTAKEIKQWKTLIDEKPPVTIEVTPIELGPTPNQWKFKITLTTHSGNLDQDLTEIVSLTDDQNNIHSPIIWEGSGPGGHHREGILIFDAVNPVPAYVELKVKDVGGVPERSFRWSLK